MVDRPQSRCFSGCCPRATAIPAAAPVTLPGRSHNMGEQDGVGDAVGDVEMAAERKCQAVHLAEPGVRDRCPRSTRAIICGDLGVLIGPSRYAAADTSRAARCLEVDRIGQRVRQVAA